MIFAKYARILLVVLMAVSAIFIGWFYFGPVVDPIAELEEPVITQAMLKFSYGLLIISVIGVIVFSIMNLIENIKNLKNVAIVLGIAAVIFFISRALASDVELYMPSYKGEGNVPSVLKNVGTGLIATYVLLGVTVLAMIYSEVSKLFK